VEGVLFWKEFGVRSLDIVGKARSAQRKARPKFLGAQLGTGGGFQMLSAIWNSGSPQKRLYHDMDRNVAGMTRKLVSRRNRV
jgi:hypothetical protein